MPICSISTAMRQTVTLRLKCHICKQDDYKTYNLRRHLKRHHGVEIKESRGKEFRRKDNQEYVYVEADVENAVVHYECLACNYHCADIIDLNIHIEQTHTVLEFNEAATSSASDNLSNDIDTSHTMLPVEESAQLGPSYKRKNEAAQSHAILSDLDKTSDVKVRGKGYETPRRVKSARRHRNLFEELTTCLEENPFDDDDTPLISVPVEFKLEFKRESEEEWLLDGEDILKTIQAYQNASLRYLRQRTAIDENVERILSLSSIILLRDRSTIFDGSSDQSHLREAIKSQPLSALKTEMNSDEKKELKLLRDILKMTLRENNRTLGLKAIDATEMKELSRLKEISRYVIGHLPFRKVSHVGRKSETETQCTVAHVYPFMLKMYGDPDSFPVVFGNSSSTASAVRIDGKYQARQPDGIMQVVHGHTTFEAGYLENKFNNATKANVAKDLMRLCRFAKDSLDLLRRRSVESDLFITLNQIVDHHVDLYFAKREADGYTLVSQVGSYELPCTIRDMLTFLDDYEELHMVFKASLDCCTKIRKVLVTNPPILADTTYRQCISTPELKKFLLL